MGFISGTGTLTSSIGESIMELVWAIFVPVFHILKLIVVFFKNLTNNLVVGIYTYILLGSGGVLSDFRISENKITVKQPRFVTHHVTSISQHYHWILSCHFYYISRSHKNEIFEK